MMMKKVAAQTFHRGDVVYEHRSRIKQFFIVSSP